MQKKILITGSNGLLGQKLMQFFALHTDFKVVGASRGKNRLTSVSNFKYYNANLSDSNVLEEILLTEKPTIIINCVAMTNVDQCEENKTECDQINVETVKSIVNYCKENDAKLIHLSTDFVFDGKKGNYKETDLVNPLNYYGMSKLKSENLITNNLIDFAIIRTILVYGTTENTNRGNIVSWVKENLENNKDINVVNDQLRMPTLVDDLVKAIDLVIAKNAKGIFHISSNELLSIYDIALIIAKEFNLDVNKIHEIKTNQLNQKAIRPLKTGFILEKAKNELGFESHSFREQMKVYKAYLN
ncbi:MAG TPA: SDR family oxidoreductase [Flavobacteriia bacterium]|nr:SDR family oxidoreductase [Flavobacteriia bacterium]